MSGSEVINATPPLSDKLSLVTHHHLLTRVPVKLDLKDWNYGSWEYFFDQLCSGYDVLKFIRGTPTDATPTSTSTELRSIQLGTLSMEAYFQKIESLVTTLTSLDCVVNDEDVVHYAITRLPEKYNQVCGYMHYQTTFPDLKTVLNRTPSISSNQNMATVVLMFAKGSCLFGSECHYVHDVNAKSHDFGTSKLSNTSNTDALLVQLLEKLNLRNKDASTHGSTIASTKETPPISPIRVAYSTQHNSSLACYLSQPINNYLAPPGFGYPTGLARLLQPAQYILPA
ncbi:ribonuclease H-like domain-containing protein [Tanacetum coccineum]